SDTQVLEGVRFWSELEQGVLYAVYQFADTGTSSISRLARIVRRDMIVVGLLRVFFFEKGANYYFSSHELLTKFSISIVVVLLSILPGRNLYRAQGKKKTSAAVREKKLRFIRFPFLHSPAFRIVTICQRQPPPPLTYTVSAVMNSQASEHMKSTN